MKDHKHPPISSVSLENILFALSDPMRLRIYAEIEGSNAPLICSHFLRLDSRKIPKSTLSKHFKILREAGLVKCERRGVEMYNSTRADEFKGAYGDMVDSIVSIHRKQQVKARKRPA